MIKLAEKLLQSSKVVNFKFKTKKPIFKEPIKIQSFVDKYGNADINVKPAEDAIERIWENFNREYQYYELHQERKYLLPRDEKYLPFILSKLVDDSKKMRFAYNIMRNNTSKKMLKNEILEYFSSYKARHAILLALDICDRLADYKGRNNRLLLFKANTYLFQENNIDEAYKRCCQMGVQDYLKANGLTGILSYSDFVKKIICMLFEADNKSFDVKNKYSLYKNVILPSNEDGSYKDIYNSIFSNLIIAVEHCNCTEKEEYIKSLRNVLVSIYKDPRIKGVNWKGISQEAREIFIKWLSQRDLKLFFEIISQSYAGSYDNQKMWRYRKQFWQAYLPEITSTWVFFGADAECEIPKSEVMKYGKFSVPSKSCIMMQIGNCIFIERSHNGKLKVWLKHECPFKMGAEKLNENILTNVSVYDEWTHSSPQSYNWQQKVSAFIQDNCGINKNEEDYEID